MIYILIAVIFLAADFITKISAVRCLTEVSTMPIFENILHLTYVENRGIAFGMFSGGRVVFIGVSIAVMAVLTIMLFKTKKEDRSVWLKLGTAMVLSGAAGNLFERITKGYVVDFIDFRMIDFPVFNVADIAVCVGVALLVIHFLFAEDDKSE